MTNPEASARLSQVEEEAFRPWQALVSALRAFYSDDAASLLDALDRISDAAPPAVLKPLFRAWALSPDAAAEEILSEASAAVVALHGRVLSQIRPIEGLAEQAEEALRQGMIQHFEADACRVLRELHESPRSDGPLLALRYAARCLLLLDEAGEDDAAFFTALLRAIGRADGLAALGLALVGRDDKAAAAAFRGAAAGGTRAFVDAPTSAVLAAAAAILEEQAAETDKRKVRPAVKRRAAAPGQLDLFPGAAV